MSDRDRDVAGRARNARPRDELGRPLPYGTAGVEPLPEPIVVEPAEGLAWAQRLLDAGRPFQAHEVLEALWKSRPADEAPLWQGLAQLAVGVTHYRRNATGITLLRRGAATMRGAPGAADRHGVDLTGLTAWAEEFALALDRNWSWLVANNTSEWPYGPGPDDLEAMAAGLRLLA